MKFLLAILMSTVIASSAFGACAKGSPQDCMTAEACKALEVDGFKVTFDAERAKPKKDAPVRPACMVADTDSKTGCDDISNLKGAKGVVDEKGKVKEGTGTIQH